MQEDTRHEINDIIHELKLIARELEVISAGVTNEFKGIGSRYCANGLEDISTRYRYVAKELDKIQYKKHLPEV